MMVESGCPSCGRAVERAPGSSVRCRRCGADAPLREHTEGPLAGCLACPCPELYRHRDFNQKLGLLLVVLGAALSLWWANILPLIGAAAVDLLLWYVLPDVAICYRCKAHHREFPGIAKIAPFDLERHEHYRFVKAREEGKLPPKG